jgi:hypothetical protein
MAEQTYTVTVASGDLYGGGTGNVYYLDGARNATGPGTVSWVKGGTLRFEQSDNSNDNHPLIFSSTTNRAQYLTSDVVYYLDGASNYGAYTNTTTFNAATTRYIEVTPSSETDFYYLCYVHGIGMGGIFDITQKTWGAQTWGAGTWDDQGSNAVEVTGVSATTSLGTLPYAQSLSGWGRDTWGSAAWGIQGTIAITGQSLSSSIGTVSVDAKIEQGWGRGAWGNRAWGETYSVELTGQQATTAVGTAIGKADVSVSVTGAGLLTITQGLNSIQIDNSVTVFVGEPALQTSPGSVVGGISGNSELQVSGQGLTTSVAAVIPEPLVEIPVTGSSLTTSLGTASLVQTTTEVVSGQTANLSVGSITPVSVYSVTGQALASSIGSVTVTGQAGIDVTGIGLTANIGSVNVTAWSEINPGVNNVWSEVDRAA